MIKQTGLNYTLAVTQHHKVSDTCIIHVYSEAINLKNTSTSAG